MGWDRRGWDGTLPLTALPISVVIIEAYRCINSKYEDEDEDENKNILKN